MLTDALLILFLVGPLIAGSSAGAGATLAAAVLVTAGVAFSRPAPTLSLLIGACVGLLYLAVGFDPLGGWPVAAMVVLGYLAGRRSVDTRAAVTIFTAACAAGLPLALLLDGGWTWVLMLAAEAAIVLPWWFGRVRRLRTRLVDAGWERAARLEHEKRMVAEQARLRERARIAQDMHDSLGHQLSLMALQAGGLELNSTLDDAIRSVAAQLREGAGRANDLLHDIIGVLSEVSEPMSNRDAAESVTALVDRTRQSGVPVVLEWDGAPPNLPPLVDRAAYRVVQESLTNAIKHAPAEKVTVRLVYRPEETTVSVTNQLPAAYPGTERPGGGRGLIGLHERVRVAGGTLRAGPRDGTFSVVAQLPTTGDRVPTSPLDEVPGWSTPADELCHARHSVRRDIRRQLRYATALPVILVATLAAVFLGLRAYTTTTTALDSADFDRLRVNQSRAEIDKWLPPASMDHTLPTVPEPPIADGVRCEYYRTTANPFTLSNDLFRLCFRGDVLVSKDHLEDDPS